MKKYEVRVDYGYITDTAAYYTVEAENGEEAEDKAASLLKDDMTEIEYYETYILTEEEV